TSTGIVKATKRWPGSSPVGSADRTRVPEKYLKLFVSEMKNLSDHAVHGTLLYQAMIRGKDNDVVGIENFGLPPVGDRRLEAEIDDAEIELFLSAVVPKPRRDGKLGRMRQSMHDGLDDLRIVGCPILGEFADVNADLHEPAQ